MSGLVSRLNRAAEMAVKGLHLKTGRDAWGHVIRRLLESFETPIVVPADLIEAARVLDAYYMPTRYPNGHPEGAPGEHYGPVQSKEAIRYAGSDR